MEEKVLEKLELNKILDIISTYACLESTKDNILGTKPLTDLDLVREKLSFTGECDKLLFKHGICKIMHFPTFKDELELASRGSTLSCGELLSINSLLSSARVCYNSISSVNDEEIFLSKKLVSNVYFDEVLEKDIESKIVSSDQVSDFASENLYRIRTSIKELNERIRQKLASYLSGDTSKYLQDNIITMREDRFVLPVKAECKSKIKGFVHDKSQTGATIFIEPEQVLDMNNELKDLYFDEKQEIEKILAELSRRVGLLARQLSLDIEILEEFDKGFAIAEYSYKNRCTLPIVNDRGIIKIEKGRHPLIDAKKVVPVSVEFGLDYDFLLISGPNTGGKTVTLKMCGLFCLMAMCGIFIPAVDGSQVSVFDNIFVDVGDEQSIEENLSLFSSHIANIVSITENANEKSLVLIDELGGGTDPEEGQALAKAIIKRLLNLKAKGVVTTHYSALKEFAYEQEGISNACMEFDKQTLQPLYRIKIGISGSSNAIAVSRRLGLSVDIINEALNNLSQGSRIYENTIRRAEESRVKAEQELAETLKLKKEWSEKVEEAQREAEKLKKEREKFLTNAKVEAKRIVNERCEQAEEYILQIDEILKKTLEDEADESDLIKARMLKNKLRDLSYNMEADMQDTASKANEKATLENVKVGGSVYVTRMQTEGEIISVNERKKEVEVLCGSMKFNLKFADVLVIQNARKKESKKEVQVVKHLETRRQVQRELKILGMTVDEAMPEVEYFIDRAIIDGLEEVKIVHGFGTGRLKNAVSNYLKQNKNVVEFRLGKYGEGESGVTIVKLK